MKKINDWYDTNKNFGNGHIWQPEKSIVKKVFWEEQEIGFDKFLKNEDKKESDLERQVDREKPSTND